ncbi:MAG: DinB family protein [Chloroflexota bacterium]|nr:DinB family protein [Chloroflexota bacterium]
MIMLTRGMSGTLIRASSSYGGGNVSGDDVDTDDTESEGSARDRERSRASGDASGRSIDGIRTALAAVPDELARLLADRSQEELSQASQDGGWGIVEILPHFLDWERVIRSRVDRILAEDTPELEEHDDSLWAIEHDYSSQNPQTALAAFRNERLALVNLLEALDDAAWNRGGILPKHGGITLHWLLNNVCDHDARHVMQVKDVLA